MFAAPTRETVGWHHEAGSPEHLYPNSDHEKLYEAYNDLHGLANDFRKPFDAPAILVVGHQTDGKSALVEALIGFQFNYVGGGTKTRRPVCLHMKYNPECSEPRCFLISETQPHQEEEKSLEELQSHIELENIRLEKDACQFWEKEIVVKIEYKYCPNLTIIDTPGLIAAAPGRKNSSLQAQARAVEALVRSKMQQKELIILCLEDSSDWSNAGTRRVVMQMDPELSRTVVVSTKLDTKIPQFARPADVELFLQPPARLLDSTILGSTPFFTSVPSGRVGSSREAVYRSNDHFRELGMRLSHIVRRLMPIAMFLLQKEGEYMIGKEVFLQKVGTSFHTFVTSQEKCCRDKCMEDLESTTRYVTWSLHNRNQSSLRLFLNNLASSDQLSSSSALFQSSSSSSSEAHAAAAPSQQPQPGALARVTAGAVTVAPVVGSSGSGGGELSQLLVTNGGGSSSGGGGGHSSEKTPQARLVDLLESTLWNRRLAPTSEDIVVALVSQIFEGIRDHFFNCFFLMPLVDKFPAALREDLESAFAGDVDCIFDTVQVRRNLEHAKTNLELELRRALPGRTDVRCPWRAAAFIDTC
eukprot:jgi/Mesen1/1793/ME000014S01207